MSDVNAGLHEWNKSVIEEFRANGGEVPSQFKGIPVLLLHNVGAKSGTTRINPLAYQPLDNAYAIFGSYAGAEKNPAWFHNLVANPEVEIEVGKRTEKVRARVATGDERTAIWERQKSDVPQFAEYEAKTAREIPVVVLEPVG